jgi:hypothetical protein
VRRIESPLVWQTWAWCSSRSTVAVARVLGHQLIEPSRVEVRRQRDRAFHIGGIHDAVEPFGGVMGYR